MNAMDPTADCIGDSASDTVDPKNVKPTNWFKRRPHTASVMTEAWRGVKFGAVMILMIATIHLAFIAFDLARNPDPRAGLTAPSSMEVFYNQSLIVVVRRYLGAAIISAIVGATVMSVMAVPKKFIRNRVIYFISLPAQLIALAGILWLLTRIIVTIILPWLLSYRLI